MKTLVVTTTIKYPQNGHDICEAINQYRMDSGNQCDFLVVLDVNFDLLQWAALYKLKEKFGFVQVLSIKEQNEMFSEYREFMNEIIFEKSVQRRNIGFMYAMKFGYDNIISIDDDNFPEDKNTWLSDFFLPPSIVLSSNVDERQWIDLPKRFSGVTSRGYPILSDPVKMEDVLKGIPENINPVVTQGLIDGDPDRTALDRYTNPEKKVKITEIGKSKFVVDNMNMVFNTQNTMFTKDIFPALFLFPMNKKIETLTIDRMDDIFMSYIVNEICRNQGLKVAYGASKMTQERNSHDLEKDMFSEMTGQCIAESVLKYIPLESKENSVLGAYIRIANQLYMNSINKKDSVHSYILSMARDMFNWSTIMSLMGYK